MQWIDITINLDIFTDLNEIQVFSSSIKIIIWSLGTIKNKSKEKLKFIQGVEYEFFISPGKFDLGHPVTTM